MRRILIAFIFVLLVSCGCHKKPLVTTPAPAPAPPPAPVESAPAAVIPSLPEPPPPESAPVSKTVPSPSNLELGDQSFEAGNYQQAAKAYEAFLSKSPKAKNRDQALFYLGLSRALASNSGRDMRQAEAAFKRLLSEFPGSPYKKQAELVLGLQAQIEKLRSDISEREDRIKQLSKELQTLKEIDLQRKPSRPE
jgi:tetratricopeptide (TPR) repeat protein